MEKGGKIPVSLVSEKAGEEGKKFEFPREEPETPLEWPEGGEGESMPVEWEQPPLEERPKKRRGAEPEEEEREKEGEEKVTPVAGKKWVVEGPDKDC